MLSDRPRAKDKRGYPKSFTPFMDLAKTGDLFLYQNHIEIRVYGCELAPYKLPNYLHVRIFALEYIRQMINSDHIHFVSLKKKQHMRTKGKIGPFICNSRAAREEADKVKIDEI
jgi:hypothetical protein